MRDVIVMGIQSVTWKSTNARSLGWSFIKDREEKTVDPVRMSE